ncbi:transcription elongation factor B polypeptide 3 [Chelonus insularis]|uniref:transcription elongation factor B polypeptide 3 n=1 Tax=Chelonus insularis TaxID=460826 RepID=UPI00158DEBC2|nr:transcription elongation factor B polypeptide 3 [Chelonus insularis]XP_034934229.1 transcription elongation factor B polypeptide 3 [Chelonus insularis]XP_034934230.1 transcription elongation factor B polypeptide 3 [Chelonus insularis]
MSGTPIINQIHHYQRSIEKYSDNEKRILHCIEKLYMLPVTVQHLQETGVGRTVNGLRKYEGTVGDAAKALVAKWKTMVVDEESSDGDEGESCVPDISEGYSDNSDSSIDKDVQTQSTRCKLDDIQDRVSKKSKEHESKHSSSRPKQPSLDNPKQKDSNTRSHHENNLDRNEKVVDQSLSLKTSYKNSDSNHESKRKRKSSDSGESKNTKHNSKKLNNDTSNHNNNSVSSKKKYSNELSHYKVDAFVENNGDAQKSRKRRSFSSDKNIDKSRNSNINESEDESISNVDLTSKRKNKEKYDSNIKIKTEKLENLTSKHKSKSHNEKTHEQRKEEIHNTSTTLNNSNDTTSHRKDKSESKSKRVYKDSSERKKSESESKSKGHKKSKDQKKINGDGGIDCNSGTSFAEALGMCAGPVSLRKKNSTVPSKSENAVSLSSKPKVKTEFSSVKTEFPAVKIEPPSLKTDEPPSLLAPNVKLEPLKVDLDSTLPEINPNYKPLPVIPAIHRKFEERKALDEAIYAKNIRTKVYSGNKSGYTSVPSLYELCIRVLIENIEALEFTGGVPYYIIKPVLERATADQLFMIEHYNPYLIEDTDELWKFHCNREFRSKVREEMESWREMYMRCLDEREAKLKTLTANIKQSIDKSLPVRSTIMAYVDDVAKPPRNILRKQAKYGTANTSSSSDIKKKIIASSLGATKVSVPAPISRSSGIVKKHKAPLMAKALQLIKGRYKR